MEKGFEQITFHFRFSRSKHIWESEGASEEKPKRNGKNVYPKRISQIFYPKLPLLFSFIIEENKPVWSGNLGDDEGDEFSWTTANIIFVEEFRCPCTEGEDQDVLASFLCRMHGRRDPRMWPHPHGPYSSWCRQVQHAGHSSLAFIFFFSFQNLIIYLFILNIYFTLWSFPLFYLEDS